MIARMTDGLSWADNKPAAVSLHSQQPRSDGACRPNAEWQIPLRMLRPTTPQSLYVCCLEEDQWVRTDQPQWFKTRVVAGSEIEKVGVFSEQHGWVRRDSHGPALEIPLEYSVEEVQHYGPLYTGERRFITFGSPTPVNLADSLTVMVPIQGVALDSGADPRAYSALGSDHLTPEIDELQSPNTSQIQQDRRHIWHPCFYLPAHQLLGLKLGLFKMQRFSRCTHV